MSALNGDKARFNRERRQKIARRKQVRELLKHAAAQPKSAGTRKTAKAESVQA
jgi:hypothetical protein